MNPEEAVRHLAQLLRDFPTLEIDQACKALSDHGLPHPQGVRIYHFTQFAWARVFMDGMGIGFSPDYLLFDRSGNVLETGKIESEAYYAAALKMAQEFRSMPGFEYLVKTSSEFKAINSALLKGSKPENLVSAPASISLEPLTAEGASRMNANIEQHIARMRGQAPPKKPWWRFW